MTKPETTPGKNVDEKRPAYVAPELTILDAGKTATGAFDSFNPETDIYTNTIPMS